MSAAKQKGTRAETAVVKFLQDMGFPAAERRATSGAKDKGDIAGLRAVCIEVKDCARMELAKWVDEADVEADNAHAAIGVVWHKRKGEGSPGAWYVTMCGHDFVTLLLHMREAGEDL